MNANEFLYTIYAIYLQVQISNNIYIYIIYIYIYIHYHKLYKTNFFFIPIKILYI